MIKFNQNAWLIPFIVMNNDPRKKAKNDFEIFFFNLINNTVFGKTKKNVRKHRYIKEPNFHTTKLFTEKLLVIETNKAQILMNKPVCLHKILMYEFWYDYVKRKYGKKAKPCFMDTGSFIAHVKT